MKETTIAKKLSEATAKLAAAGIENARLDAEVLLAYVLNTRRLALYVHVAKVLSQEQLTRYDNLIQRRIERIPVAYLTGHKEFMGMNFAVTPDVLIPRPDTEVLAQGVIEHLQDYSGALRLADLGTGSGAICISILKFIDHISAAAVDISEKALDIARFNAQKFGVDNRIEFYHGNLLEPLAGKTFDVIVSNPPYIATKEFETIQPEVLEEPKLALDGGVDGLNYYRKIIDEAPDFLTDDGFLALEIGINQQVAVMDLIKRGGKLAYVQLWKDLSNVNRVIAAWKR